MLSHFSHAGRVSTQLSELHNYYTIAGLRIVKESARAEPVAHSEDQVVIPAKAGNQIILTSWVPACAGMTWIGVETLFRMCSEMREGRDGSES